MSKRVPDKEIGEYVRWMFGEGFSASTVRHAKTFVRFLEAKGLDMENITQKKALDFLIDAQIAGVRIRTVNGWLRQIKRWGRFKGVMIDIPRRKDTGMKDVRYIPDEKVKELFKLEWNRYDETIRNRALLMLLFSTGMRVTELISLDWNDIDWQRNLVLIKCGKGGKTRQVPVPQSVLEVLEKYREVRIKTDPRAVFTTNKGRMSDAMVRKIVKEAGVRVGEPWLHPHAARHWRAKSLLRQGVTLNAVQKVLGHSNIKTTSVYLEMTYDEVVRDLEGKDVFFQGVL